MATQPDPAAELLLRAVDALPEDERRQVLAWLLQHLTAPAALSHAVLAALGPHAGEVAALQTAPAGGAQQVVPVRFPVEQHAALRSWCQEHGFTMATVVRGLVARFLERERTR